MPFYEQHASIKPNTSESLTLFHISHPAKLCTECRINTFHSCYSLVKGGQINGFA